MNKRILERIAGNQWPLTKEKLLAIARNGALKLPLPPMLMLDKVLSMSKEGGKHKRGSAEAEMIIEKDLWFFPVHFRGDPVMPACLLLDGLWQLSGLFLLFLGCQGSGRAIGAGAIKMHAPVTPEDKSISYFLDIKRFIQKPLPMIFADGGITKKGKDVMTVDGIRVCAAPQEESS